MNKETSWFDTRCDNRFAEHPSCGGVCHYTITRLNTSDNHETFYYTSDHLISSSIYLRGILNNIKGFKFENHGFYPPEFKIFERGKNSGPFTSYYYQHKHRLIYDFYFDINYKCIKDRISNKNINVIINSILKLQHNKEK